MAGSSASNSFYKEVMDFVLTNTSAPLIGVTSFYVGLLVSGTTQGNAMLQSYSEVGTGIGYSRIQMNRSSTSGSGISGWQYNSGSLEYSNASDIIFGVPSNNWGTIVAVGLFKSSTTNSTDMMYYAGLSSSKVVNSGDGAPRILAGQLRLARSSC